MKVSSPSTYTVVVRAPQARHPFFGWLPAQVASSFAHRLEFAKAHAGPGNLAWNSARSRESMPRYGNETIVRKQDYWMLQKEAPARDVIFGTSRCCWAAWLSGCASWTLSETPMCYESPPAASVAAVCDLVRGRSEALSEHCNSRLRCAKACYLQTQRQSFDASCSPSVYSSKRFSRRALRGTLSGSPFERACSSRQICQGVAVNEAGQRSSCSVDYFGDNFRPDADRRAIRVCPGGVMCRCRSLGVSARTGM